MQIERNYAGLRQIFDGEFVRVRISPEYILQQFISGRLALQDLRYICLTIGQLAHARIRKRSITQFQDTIFKWQFFDIIDTTSSAKLCIDLLNAAGISKKGAASVRTMLRDQFSATFSDGEVINVPEAPSLSGFLKSNQYVSGLNSRAVAAGTEFINTHFGNAADCNWDTIVRIGLLVLARTNDPEFMLELEFGLVGKEQECM